MPARPQLLFLAQCLPYPPHAGVTSRTFNILKQLEQEFEVTLVAFSRVNHQPDAEVRTASWHALERHLTRVAEPAAIPGEWSRSRRVWDHLRSVVTGRPYIDYEYWSEDFHRRLDLVLAKVAPAMIHLDSMDLHRWVGELPDRPTACTHHAIESELLRLRAEKLTSPALRWYIHYQADLLERAERQQCPTFELNTMMSDLDAVRLKALAPGSKTLVVPNGVDVDYFAPTPLPVPVGGRVVFVGPTYSYPNKDAVEFLLGEIWPSVRARYRGASLQLIGRGAEADLARYATHPGVECPGYLPDIRPTLSEASCCVVPIRIGGGTRLKILDAWAMGKAVVSTSIGCEGLATVDGENILIRDTAEGLADAAVEVLQDSRLRDRLGAHARDTAVRHYSWDGLGRRLREAYHAILAAA